MAELALGMMFVLFLVREYVNFTERKDLLNRLMSKDFNDYVAKTAKPEASSFADGNEAFVDLEDEEAQEALLNND